MRFTGLSFERLISAEDFKHYKPDPESYLGVVDSMYLKPHQVMLVAAHNGDLAAAQKCGLSTGFVMRPNEHGPGRRTPPRESRVVHSVNVASDVHTWR